MRKTWYQRIGLVGVLALAAVVIASAGQGAEAPAVKGTWVVHEWGTFLSVQGSDGASIGGMIDSEENLPRFVRERSLNGWSRASMTQKMETPVTYFYTDQPREVQVRVDMPLGQLTHWFPAVLAYDHQPGVKEQANVRGSFLDWGKFQVLPDSRFLPAGKPDAPNEGRQGRMFVAGAGSTWPYARETDSALVKVNANGSTYLEKFLFYRGLGSFELPLEVRSNCSDEYLHLLLHNRGETPLQGLFAVWVAGDSIRFCALADLPGGGSRDLEVASSLCGAQPLEIGVPFAKQAVAEALVRAGLYPKEAQAMVNTWDHSYFRTEGLRVLSVLPRATVDATIPIRIQPAPQELQRVMIGRVEVLTPDAERKLEKTVADLGSKDAPVRAAAQAELARFGRFQEPALRRLVALTKNAEVRARAETMLPKGTVTK